MENQITRPWWQKDWFVILLFLFFTPLGLYWMWKYSSWTRTWKWLHTIVFGIPLLLFFFWWIYISVTWLIQAPSEGKSFTEIVKENEEPEEVFPQNESEWEEYTKEKYAISFKYPKDWTLLDSDETTPWNESETLTLMLADPNIGDSYSGLPDVTVSVYPKTVRKDYAFSNDITEVFSEETIKTTQGLSGTKTTGNYSPNTLEAKNIEETYHQNSIVFETTNNYIKFSAIYPTSSKNKDVYLQIFDYIVNSFTANT